MDSLEKYIREQAPAFDSESPSEEAREQFLARWEEADRSAGSRRLRFLHWTLPAVAAGLAILFLVTRPRTADPFQGVESDPEGIYARYLAQVAEGWQAVGADENAAGLLYDLTEESIPLIDQLPEELPEAEKAEILRGYYGTLLEKTDLILKYVKD